uniref:Guanylate cyclase (inferred by orthology to a C. elegans protein) n=1 Tax=Strongyloides venezuelensis TaxID=75913 RepID=A0A0K0FA18_STRVS
MLLFFYSFIILYCFDTVCSSDIEAKNNSEIVKETTPLPIDETTTFSSSNNDVNNDIKSTIETKQSLLNGSTIRKGKGKIIRVGHIGAMNAMPGAEKILDMSRKELWRDGILDDEFDVELIQARACGEAFEGVAVAADMFHLQDVKAFIGPYCNAEMDAVSKMATYWNVPIIGYMAASNIFSDKVIYKTLSRVSIRTTNSLAVAVVAMLKHYHWQNIAIVTNTGILALEVT